MTKDWALFWVGMGFMAMAGAIGANVVLGSPMQVGALGQWASAAGTIAAVMIAVRNTRISIRDAAERDQVKQDHADQTYANSLFVLARLLKLSADAIEKQLMDKPVSPEVARTVASRLHLDGLTAALDRMPLHLAPNPEMVICFGNLRTASTNLSSKLQDIASGKTGKVLDAGPEIKLIADTIPLLQEFVDDSLAQ